MLHQVAKAVFHLGFAHPEHAHHAGVQHDAAAFLQIRHHGGFEHRRHLFGRTRQQDRSLFSVLNNAAGCSTVRVWHDDTAAREHCLFEIVWRHLASHAVKPHADMFLRSRIKNQIAAKCVCDRFFCQIVCRGAQAARQNEQIRPGERKFDCRNQAVMIIPDRRLEIAVNAKVAQFLRDILGIRVNNVSHQQLCANGQDFRRHRIAFLFQSNFSTLRFLMI